MARGCSTVVELTPRNQQVMSSNPPVLGYLKQTLDLFQLFFTKGVSLIRSLKEVHLHRCIVKANFN